MNFIYTLKIKMKNISRHGMSENSSNHVESDSFVLAIKT